MKKRGMLVAVTLMAGMAVVCFAEAGRPTTYPTGDWSAKSDSPKRLIEAIQVARIRRASNIDEAEREVAKAKDDLRIAMKARDRRQITEARNHIQDCQAARESADHPVPLEWPSMARTTETGDFGIGACVRVEDALDAHTIVGYPVFGGDRADFLVIVKGCDAMRFGRGSLWSAPKDAVYHVAPPQEAIRHNITYGRLAVWEPWDPTQSLVPPAPPTTQKAPAKSK